MVSIAVSEFSLWFLFLFHLVLFLASRNRRSAPSILIILLVLLVLIIPIVHRLLQLRTINKSGSRWMMGGGTYHLEQLVALVEMRHDYTLALGYGPVGADELAVLAHRVDLEERKLVLCTQAGEIVST
jgi:hypothetical protein